MERRIYRILIVISLLLGFYLFTIKDSQSQEKMCGFGLRSATILS